MIAIKPTTESGLNHNDYSVNLVGVELNPLRPRAQKITVTLDGSAATTLWAKNNAGAQQTVESVLSLADYNKLYAIVGHETAYEWVVFCDGRRYVCGIDITNCVSLGLNEKKVTIIFTVL